MNDTLLIQIPDAIVTHAMLGKYIKLAQERKKTILKIYSMKFESVVIKIINIDISSSQIQI